MNNFRYISHANLATHRLEQMEADLVESETQGTDIVSKIPYILMEVNSIVREFMKDIQGMVEFIEKGGFMVVGEREANMQQEVVSHAA